MPVGTQKVLVDVVLNNLVSKLNESETKLNQPETKMMQSESKLETCT